LEVKSRYFQQAQHDGLIAYHELQVITMSTARYCLNQVNIQKYTDW